MVLLYVGLDLLWRQVFTGKCPSSMQPSIKPWSTKYMQCKSTTGSVLIHQLTSPWWDTAALIIIWHQLPWLQTTAASYFCSLNIVTMSLCTV